MTAEPTQAEPPVFFRPTGGWVPEQGEAADSGRASASSASGRSGEPVEPARPQRTVQDLGSGRAARRLAALPQQGWRRTVHRLTGVNLGPSRDELRVRELVEQVTVPFVGSRRVLFVNPKGGAGKTTTCLGVASTFGTHRGRGVVAFDNNPTRGTLGLRAHADRHGRTVTHLLDDLEGVRRVGDLSAYTRAQRDSHFAVLASDEDPALAVARDDRDYRAVLDVLDTFHEVICVDTGNDVTAPVFTAALSTTDQLVVVTGSSWDSAHSASWLLDHLQQHGHDDLVAHAVTVLNGAHRDREAVREVREHFEDRTRSVHQVPHDPALETGEEIHLDRLRPATRRAWLEVAAAVAAEFPFTRSPSTLPEQP